MGRQAGKRIGAARKEAPFLAGIASGYVCAFVILTAQEAERGEGFETMGSTVL